MSNFFFFVSLLITLYMNEPRYKLKCFYHWSFACMLNCCPHKSYFHNTKLVLTLNVEPCKGQIFFFHSKLQILFSYERAFTKPFHVKYCYFACEVQFFSLLWKLNSECPLNLCNKSFLARKCPFKMRLAHKIDLQSLAVHSI